MKKLISFALVLLSLSVLINCSPKTAKKTAASEDSKSKKETAKENVNEEVKAVPVESSVIAASDVAVAKPFYPLSDVSIDQQIMMYKDMAPLRAEIGKKIYTTHCNKCHGYKAPETKTPEGWINIMPKMGANSKLNTDEYLEVTAYLVQNAKK